MKDHTTKAQYRVNRVIRKMCQTMETQDARLFNLRWGRSPIGHRLTLDVYTEICTSHSLNWENNRAQYSVYNGVAGLLYNESFPCTYQEWDTIRASFDGIAQATKEYFNFS